MPFPEISNDVFQANVRGTSEPGALVFLYETDDSISSYGEGKNFIVGGSGDNPVTADPVTGEWNTGPLLVSPGDRITATATDTNGNSSEFCQNAEVSTDPTITKIVPNATCIGATTKIHGYNFGDKLSYDFIEFNGAHQQSVHSWSDTEIELEVPGGITSGNVRVSHSRVFSNSKPFTVLSPGIEITKTGPAEGSYRKAITYQFTVRNTGGAPLTNVTVTDPLFGATWSEVIGDLAVGESLSFQKDYTISNTDPDPLVNTARVSGRIAPGVEVSDEDTHTADVVSPGSTVWYLAEGSTGSDERGNFETWVLVQNPGDTQAEVDVFYQTPTEEVPGPHLSLDPHTRQTVNVADTIPGQWSVSTRVVSDNPVIAERAMYWMSSAGIYRQCAHDSIGVTGAGTGWYLAEGSTGSDERGNFETWVLVQNPGDTQAEVDVFYQTPTEEVPGPHLSLDPHTRQTVNVADTIPGQWSVSTRVVSDNPVIAERAMYWMSSAGIYRQCAHDSIGYDP